MFVPRLHPQRGVRAARHERFGLLRPAGRGTARREGGELVGGRWQQNIYSYPPIGSPDGGAHCTADDLLRFLRGMRGGELLSPASTAAWFTPQVRHDDRVQYGFGLEFGAASFWKEGVNNGVSGFLVSYPQAGVDAVVLSTGEAGAWPVVRALNAAFRDPHLDD